MAAREIDLDKVVDYRAEYTAVEIQTHRGQIDRSVPFP